MSVNKKLASIEINGETYDEVPEYAVRGTRMLMNVYKRLGSPTDPLSDNGRKMMEVIISFWEDLYPLEAKAWFEARKEHLEAEMSIQDQVKFRTGRSLASYPLPIIRMMKTFFRGFDPCERNNCIKLLSYFPMFKMVNRI